MYDFQKANMWKRISAWLFDFILIGIVIVGVACLLSLALRFDQHYENQENTLADFYVKYEEKYGVHLNMPKYDPERYENLTDEEEAAYLDAVAKETDKIPQNIEADTELTILYNKYVDMNYLVVSIAFVVVSFSVLIGFLIMEFIIPLILKNGQTLGKKIFGVGVMRVDGVRVTPLQMLLRSVLGKGTLETLVPAYMVLMFVFGIGLPGIVCLAVVAGLLLSEIVLFFATLKKARTPIHDIMAGTVTVDFASQMIFDSPEELLAYKQNLHADMVNSTREEAPRA